MNSVSPQISYAQYLRTSHCRSYPQEHRRGHGNLRYDMVLLDVDSHEALYPDVPDLLLSLPLTISGESLWTWEIGRECRQSRFEVDHFLVVPPNTYSRWQSTGQRKQLYLVIPPDTIRRTLRNSCPANLNTAFTPLSTSCWTDPFLRVLMVEAWESLSERRPTNRLLADSIVTTILTQLLQRAGTCQRVYSPVALPPRKLRRVIDYVEENLETNLDLSVLAELAKLSVRHFGRAFQTDVGQTPHQYLVSRRLERAKMLMRHSDLTLSMIASRSGFADQSHLTRAMKKMMKVTPAAFRRSIDF